METNSNMKIRSHDLPNMRKLRASWQVVRQFKMFGQWFFLMNGQVSDGCCLRAILKTGVEGWDEEGMPGFTLRWIKEDSNDWTKAEQWSITMSAGSAVKHFIQKGENQDVL